MTLYASHMLNFYIAIKFIGQRRTSTSTTGPSMCSVFRHGCLNRFMRNRSLGVGGRGHPLLLLQVQFDRQVKVTLLLSSQQFSQASFKSQNRDAGNAEGLRGRLFPHILSRFYQLSGCLTPILLWMKDTGQPGLSKCLGPATLK